LGVAAPQPCAPRGQRARIRVRHSRWLGATWGASNRGRGSQKRWLRNAAAAAGTSRARPVPADHAAPARGLWGQRRRWSAARTRAWPTDSAVRRRAGRTVGLEPIEASQVVCQGLEQGRGPQRPGRPGPQRRGGPVRRGHRALGTPLLQPPLSGAPRDLLDHARLARDAGRADPREVRLLFFPFGAQA